MNKIQLIDAETLYYKPLAHPRMLIDGILADGLAVMAGDSKIGKSWMVLWLCGHFLFRHFGADVHGQL